jgi:arsenate reductase
MDRVEIAAALFNLMADPSLACAVSAGTSPADRIHAEVLEVMREVGIDLSKATPQLLTTELAAGARLLVTMGCGEECPYLPGIAVEDWPIEDPKGQPLSRVRAIRDEIRTRVLDLVEKQGWRRPADR